MALAGAAWSAALDSDDVSAIMGTPPKSSKVLRLKRLVRMEVYTSADGCGLKARGPHVCAALLFLTVYLYSRRLRKTQMACLRIFYLVCFVDCGRVSHDPGGLTTFLVVGDPWSSLVPHSTRVKCERPSRVAEPLFL